MRVSRLLLVLAWLPVLASPAVASNQDVRFLFHLVEVQGEGDACAQRPTDVPCTEAVTHGELETPYYAYLMVARGDTAAGIQGITFGIAYRPGIEIQDWMSCTTGLQFPTDNWPASCSGNIMTWILPRDCQRSTVPGYESQGVLAIAGVFRLVAHDDWATLRIANHPAFGDEGLQVSDCSNEVLNLGVVLEGPVLYPPMGAVSFGTGWWDYNPCAPDLFDYFTPFCPNPTPVLPVTWGRIKSLYR